MSRTDIDLKKCPAFQSLSSQHQKFVLEYLKDFNATQAAIRAKYSKNSANEQAARLLAKDSIQKAVEEVKAQITKGDVADVQEVAEFLTLVMRGNIKKVASWREDGLSFSVSYSDNLNNDTARLIKKVKVTEKTSQKGDWTECKTEVELHDPVRAAELLGKYHGMFVDKVEVGKPGEFENRLEAAKKRSLEAVIARRNAKG